MTTTTFIIGSPPQTATDAPPLTLTTTSTASKLKLGWVTANNLPTPTMKIATLPVPMIVPCTTTTPRNSSPAYAGAAVATADIAAGAASIVGSAASMFLNF